MNFKKLLLQIIASVLLLFYSLQCNAQFKKGDWVTEGNIGNVASNTDKFEFSAPAGTNKQDNKTFKIDLAPAAGYFFTDNLVAGLAISFNYFNSTSKVYLTTGTLAQQTKSVTPALSIAPFVRCYFAGNETLSFYGQVKGGMVFTLSDKNVTTGYNSSGIATSKYVKNSLQKPRNTFGEVLIGFNYFLSEKIAFNSSIGYSYNEFNATQSTTFINLLTNVSTAGSESGSKLISGSVSWNTGFTIILNRIKKQQQ